MQFVKNFRKFIGNNQFFSKMNQENDLLKNFSLLTTFSILAQTLGLLLWQLLVLKSTREERQVQVQ